MSPAQGDTDGSCHGGERPDHRVQQDPQRGIERDRARTDEPARQRGGGEHDRVLHAALVVPEAARRGDRDDHQTLPEEHRRRQWRQQADDQ